jgi:signal transduction histidine kinase
LPELVDAQATELLAAGRPVDDILPGQSSALLIANSLITGLLGIATGGYLLLARRSGDPQVGWLAMALAFLCVGQAHAVLFPPVVVDYGTSGDAFRVGGYLVLLSSLVTRLQLEIAERASQAERLRLSRELHDGLTQQLALLSLRLAQTGAKPCSAESHARELEVARRQVESALLEARQAIGILRTGSVAWDRFEETVRTFTDEFADNHCLEIDVDLAGAAPTVDAGIQAEILRILHEAFSNALRHGGATRIKVTLEAASGWLMLCVHDDGRGFEPSLELRGPGVGLASMRERLNHRGGEMGVDSAPGQGVTVHARMPMRTNAHSV